MSNSKLVSGEMVRDLMIAAVERRFGTAKAPHKIEWLSDNGSAYTAKPTADTVVNQHGNGTPDKHSIGTPLYGATAVITPAELVGVARPG